MWKDDYWTKEDLKKCLVWVREELYKVYDWKVSYIIRHIEEMERSYGMLDK